MCLYDIVYWPCSSLIFFFERRPITVVLNRKKGQDVFSFRYQRFCNFHNRRQKKLSCLVSTLFFFRKFANIFPLGLNEAHKIPR